MHDFKMLITDFYKINAYRIVNNALNCTLSYQQLISKCFDNFKITPILIMFEFTINHQ